VRHDSFEIVPHVRGSDTDGPDPAPSKPCIPAFVTLGIGAEVVRKAVDLNRDRRFETEKVQIVRTMLVLFPEFESIWPGLECIP
jgi:hypothetical protein